MPRLALAALGLLALNGRAGAPNSRYAAEMERLETGCRDRGGILSPIPGARARSGSAAATHSCHVSGGAVTR